MTLFPEPLARLIAALNRLPGIGPRSAERLALFLVQADPSISSDLSRTLTEARERIRACEICGALTETQPCMFCSRPDRSGETLCLVERSTDILSIEKAGGFRGRYHVLGGKISPVNGVGPEDLRIAELEARLDAEGVREVIIALGTDVEGDATSYYLAKRLGASGVAVSRIAHGLPAGTGLDHADELTLQQALEGRRPMSSS